jgi:DNA gyrase/topoisomerase IV subunit B
MTKNYSSKDVRVLDEVEHIRLNPSMYIGDTSNPVHLVEEALDNALDEALAGFATIIAVNLDLENQLYSVIDNGRGIPISDNTPITISTKLFSGAKFQDKKTAYEISSGLHGVGLVAVNALSEHFRIEIYRNRKRAWYNFENTKMVRKRVSQISNEEMKDKPFSTKIEFRPSSKIFETLQPDIERIRQRLITASAQMPNTTFVLNTSDSSEVINLSLDQHFAENCLTTRKDVIMIRVTAEKKPESFEVMFAYEREGPITPRVLSSINLLPVASGGTHVNVFNDMLKDFFITKAKKFGYRFQPSDCLVGFRAYFMLSLKEPKFAGQTKDKLTNRKTYFESFIKSFRTQLESWANKQPEILEELLSRFQEYRKKHESKKLVTNGTGKRASTKFTKLRDCTRRDGELFIVEGDSAGGLVLQSRKTEIHAVLPLKGKSIPNVITHKDILKNKEVAEFIMALGTGVGPHFNLSKLRYDKIICAADADHDGAHIACLVTMMIAKLVPEVVKSGKYYIAQTPLFAINEKKTFIPLWTPDQLKKAREQKRNISRFKGLGELSPHQMKVCLLDEKTRHLIPIKYSEKIDELSNIFSNVDAKRKLLEE